LKNAKNLRQKKEEKRSEISGNLRSKITEIDSLKERIDDVVNENPNEFAESIDENSFNILEENTKKLNDDIKNLKKKVDAGADHLISQLFFDNRVFYDFLERARIADINVPIEAGIMPVTNKKQIERMVSMCGASIPAKLSKVLQRFGDNHEAMRDAGISYAIDQIIELAAHGVDGVHIYTMNDPYVARRISEGVKNILKSGK